MNAVFKLQKEKKSNFCEVRGMIIVIVETIFLALFFRTFFFQPFTIPSGSMRPTLLVGDYLFVSKYAYGYSKYSFPGSLNLFSGRIWSGTPERGDISVFRYPPDPSIDYIKRVIGLPGDRIQMLDGILYINGNAVQRKKISETRSVDMIGYIPLGGRLYNQDIDRPVAVYRETLPNGVSYDTYSLFEQQGPMDNTRIFEVPDGHYFVMGDNRDNSKDSRDEVGYVPIENFVGRANLIFFSISGNSPIWKIWNWPSNVRWDRLFTFVQTLKKISPGP